MNITIVDVFTKNKYEYIFQNIKTYLENHYYR